MCLRYYPSAQTVETSQEAQLAKVGFLLGQVGVYTWLWKLERCT